MPRCGGPDGVPLRRFGQGLAEKPRGGAPVRVADGTGAFPVRVLWLDPVEQRVVVGGQRRLR